MLDSADSKLARRCYFLAALLLIGGLLATLIDLPLARFCLASRVPGDLRQVLNWSEAFAHGTGVALIALVVICLDPARRWRWPRILCMAYGAGLIVNGVKLTVGRYRPRYFFEQGLDDPSVQDTVVGWFACLTHGLEHSVQSFPSGHTATACGLAVGIGRTYPQAWWLFVALATLAAFQRMDAGAHFLSDVLTGAAIGLCVGGLLVDRRLLGAFFERFEQPL